MTGAWQVCIFLAPNRDSVRVPANLPTESTDSKSARHVEDLEIRRRRRHCSLPHRSALRSQVCRCRVLRHTPEHHVQVQ